VTTTAPDSPGTRYKQCDTCGFATPATRTRCHNCWNAIDQQAPDLETEAAADLLQKQGDVHAARALANKRRRRIRLAIIGLITAAFVWWIGSWVYSTFIYTPPPVPTPVSTELQTSTGPSVWATSGGDVRGTRQASVSPPLEAAEAWNSRLSWRPSTPVVADGERLYAILANDQIVAVDIEDGSVVWEYRLSGAPLAAPTVAGDQLFVALRAGQLLILNAADGTPVRYSLNTGVRFGTSPLVVDGVAYVFGVGAVVALDAETAEVLWQTPFGSDFAFTNPVVSDGYLAGVGGDQALIFDRGNGAQTYFYEMPRAFPYSIVERDGVFYVSYSRFTAALEEHSLRPWWDGVRGAWFQFWLWGMAPDVPAPPALWQRGRPPINGYPGALLDDAIVLAGPNGDIVAVALSDGADLWRHRYDPIFVAPLATPDGVLVAHDDRLALLSASSGEVLHERPVDGEPHDVVLTDRGLFVIYADGRITAIR
jgi:hypothetical protein